jgi:site-specific DNA-methyltransferase (adenine-specific)
MVNDGVAQSLDEILCDPQLGAQFDQVAQRLAPGFTPIEYRWAALQLRKAARRAKNRAAVLTPPKRLGEKQPVDSIDLRRLPPSPGVFVLSDSHSSRLYVGEALNLKGRLSVQFGGRARGWTKIAPTILVQSWPLDQLTAGALAWQFCLVNKYKRPRFNYREVRQAQ